MKTLKVTHIDTGRHGYASVSKAIIKQLGLINEISHYSGMNQTRVFLEEDRDFTLFIETAKNNGFVVVVKESYNEKHNISHNYSAKYFDLKEGDQVQLKMNNQLARVESIQGARVKLEGYHDISYNNLLRAIN